MLDAWIQILDFVCICEYTSVFPYVPTEWPIEFQSDADEEMTPRSRKL